MGGAAREEEKEEKKEERKRRRVPNQGQPRGRVCQNVGNSLLVAGGQRVEFNSEATAAAGFGVNAVAFERLEHTTRAKEAPYLGGTRVVGGIETSGPAALGWLVRGGQHTL